MERSAIAKMNLWEAIGDFDRSTGSRSLPACTHMRQRLRFSSLRLALRMSRAFCVVYTTADKLKHTFKYVSWYACNFEIPEHKNICRWCQKKVTRIVATALLCTRTESSDLPLLIGWNILWIHEGFSSDSAVSPGANFWHNPTAGQQCLQFATASSTRNCSCCRIRPFRADNFRRFRILSIS